MTQATGGTDGASILSTSLASVTTSSGASSDGDQTNDSNWPSIIHAVALSVAFIIIMPLGAVVLRIIPASVRWHWVNQSLATILVAIGGVIGLWLSTMYNKSKNYNSAHQILGLICVIAVFLQWGLGFCHHRQYKRNQMPTRYGSVHVYLGRLILVLAIVVGIIGLTWSAVVTSIVIIYAVISGVILIVVLGLVFWKRPTWTPLSFLSAFKRSRRPLSSESSHEHLNDPFANRFEYRPHDANLSLSNFPQTNQSV